jgi:hypothetical protein
MLISADVRIEWRAYITVHKVLLKVSNVHRHRHLTSICG